VVRGIQIRRHDVPAFIKRFQTQLLHIIHGKPFWIWDKQQHKLEDIKMDGDCCFNHIVGLPQKDGIDKPLYDYEEIVFDFLVT